MPPRSHDSQHVSLRPEALPPVASRHLLEAWDLAGEAALAASAGVAAPRPLIGDLAVADGDAACWVGGLEHRFGAGTAYGAAVAVRLLALVELLCKTAWHARYVARQAQGLRLHPQLVRAAAEAALNDDAGFDEQDLLRRLQHRIAATCA